MDDILMVVYTTLECHPFFFKTRCERKFVENIVKL